MAYSRIRLKCFLVVSLVIVSLDASSCSYVKNMWNPTSSVFHVVGKFAFSKSDIQHEAETKGYIYGNVSSLSHPDETRRKAALVLLDHGGYSKLSALLNRNQSALCDSVGKLIDQVAYDEHCRDNVEQDLLRYVPCRKDSLCQGGFPSSKDSMPGYQFTFVVTDQKEPTFWYLLFIACVRDGGNETCEWMDTSKQDIVLSYDVWFVNGNPLVTTGNFFTHQFSYEQQDTILYLIMVVLYAVLTTLQLYAFIRQRHRNLLVYLFTCSLSMHCLSFFFVVLHKLVFCSDGIGFTTLSTIADILKLVSMAVFVLFVLIIAKGWPVTRTQVTAKPLLLLSWVVYLVIQIVLYTWATTKSAAATSEEDMYHSLPVWINMGLRIVLMLWFLFELRATMMLEQDQQKLRFYLHFGAGMMVWFVHFPIVLFIGLHISLMWRYKLILGFTFAADFLAYAVVANFIWPTRQSNRFLTHYVDSDYSEELDEYEEPPTDTIGQLATQNISRMNGHHVNRFAYENQLHNHIKA